MPKAQRCGDLVCHQIDIDSWKAATATPAATAARAATAWALLAAWGVWAFLAAWAVWAFLALWALWAVWAFLALWALWAVWASSTGAAAAAAPARRTVWTAPTVAVKLVGDCFCRFGA